VCAKVCNKISKCGIKRDRYFVEEVETQLREKPEDKTSYKAVALT